MARASAALPDAERWRDRRATEQKLVAALSLHESRALELVWLRALALASLPAWWAVYWRSMPGLLRWLAFLGQGFCLAMVTAYAVLERRWCRRVAQLEPVSYGLSVQAIRTPWDEVRTALWYGLSVVSGVPWAYAGFGRAVPEPLAQTLCAAGWVVLLLVAAAETLAVRHRAGRERGSAHQH
jgi:hypothetical protein